MHNADIERRFGGIDRLYGKGTLKRFLAAHVCVVGVGGVGSWVAEALARNGIGRITLIDLDNVAESNVNRQVHALDGEFGKAKVRAMAERIARIHPGCHVVEIEEFVEPGNVAELVPEGCVALVDACDQVRAKAALLAHCRKHKIRCVCAGAAGGKSDPTRIAVADLAQSVHDPLLSKVRALLRKEYGFPRETGKKFGVECVFSHEQVRRPEPDTNATACAMDGAPQGLSCAGYGSGVTVTASFGLFAASRILERLARR